MAKCKTCGAETRGSEGHDAYLCRDVLAARVEEMEAERTRALEAADALTMDTQSLPAAMDSLLELLRQERSRNEDERRAHALTREELAEARRWNDDEGPDEWTEAIGAAFPTNSGSHDEYALAMRMVHTRRSKGAIVALVNWLLVEHAATRGELAEAKDKIGEWQQSAIHVCTTLMLSLGKTGAADGTLRDAKSLSDLADAVEKHMASQAAQLEGAERAVETCRTAMTAFDIYMRTFPVGGVVPQEWADAVRTMRAAKFALDALPAAASAQAGDD